MVSSKRCLAVILAVLFLPLISLGIMNYVVDPYNVNQQFDLRLSKDKVSYRANYRLYKMQEFRRHPCENILLGDSRIDGLDTAEIERITGDTYFNFAYGGGTAYEIVDTFWYAANHVKLKRVYIGVNFNIYNASNRLDLVPEAERTLAQPLTYYFSLYTTKISLYNLCYKVLGINMVSETPTMEKSVFWKEQLGKTTKNFYGRYIYPEDLCIKFEQIRDYCREHDIELVFIIPPTHVDLQNEVASYGLTQEYARYKSDLHSFGKVFDFDVDTSDNRDYDLYRDPYHAGKEIKEKVIHTVWSGDGDM